MPAAAGSTPIRFPADESRWGLDAAYWETAQSARQLRAILEKAATQADAGNAEDRRLITHPAWTRRRSKRLGVSPLKAGPGSCIAALTDKESAAGFAGRFAAPAGGRARCSSFGVGQDAKNAEAEIAIFDQDGMGLPDRDYYLKTDSRQSE